MCTVALATCTIDASLPRPVRVAGDGRRGRGLPKPAAEPSGGGDARGARDPGDALNQTRTYHKSVRSGRCQWATTSAGDAVCIAAYPYIVSVTGRGPRACPAGPGHQSATLPSVLAKNFEMRGCAFSAPAFRLPFDPHGR